MIERFLRYSLENGRKITLMIEDEKGLRRVHVTVLSIGADAVTCFGPRGRQRTLQKSHILSAAYARGDDGDTLARENAQYAQKTKN